MHVVENLSKEELAQVVEQISEAFMTNELFHEFGSLEERREIVRKYMKAYVECVYRSKCLYQSEKGKAYIGLGFSNQKAVMPQMKMLFQLLFIIPYSKMKRFMKHVREIADGNKRYTQGVYLEVQMVCVAKEEQGTGRARELVEFAKQMAAERGVPLIIDTDMEDYAEMYQHLGCTLYHTKTAFNGVTRYNLVWENN